MKYWYSSNLAKISCWKMQVQIMFFNPSSILSCKNWQHKIAPSKLLYRSVRVANKIRLTSPLFIEVWKVNGHVYVLALSTLTLSFL